MAVLKMVTKGLNGGGIMCSECRRFPCHYSCPNAPEPKVRDYCKKCGDELIEGFVYYTDNENNNFCSDDCALEYHGVRSKEWDCEEDDW